MLMHHVYLNPFLLNPCCPAHTYRPYARLYLLPEISLIKDKLVQAQNAFSTASKQWGNEKPETKWLPWVGAGWPLPESKWWWPCARSLKMCRAKRKGWVMRIKKWQKSSFHHLYPPPGHTPPSPWGLFSLLRRRHIGLHFLQTHSCHPSHFLKLNSNKTEALLIISKSIIRKSQHTPAPPFPSLCLTPNQEPRPHSGQPPFICTPHSKHHWLTCTSHDASLHSKPTCSNWPILFNTNCQFNVKNV